MSAVLVVEDESHLAEGLRFNLESEGFKVDTVSDGETAVSLLLKEECPYDVVVLDVMLPGMDGFAVTSELRTAGQFVPVLMLTALGRPEEVLRGFESGADDYLPKPFDLAVFMARLNALLRRREWFEKRATENGRAKTESNRESGEVFTFDGKIIDLGSLELRTPRQTVRLTLMEAQLLRYLVKQQGKVISRKAILEDVWGLREDTDTRAIDNFIVRLRRYIEDEPSRPRYLLTVRGVGYRFVAG
jgi:two-component system alkaline phosphatase synthesis response regulator PhoP